MEPPSIHKLWMLFDETFQMDEEKLKKNQPVRDYGTY